MSMKDESIENNIVCLYGRGWSMRRLSREFGMSRERVKRILERHAKERESGVGKVEETVQGPSKLDAYKPYIGELLERYTRPAITNQRIYELLREKGYEGKITILRNYLVQVRGKKPAEPVFCVETLPGQRASHDWSDYFIRFTDGQVEKIIFLSFILNYSRRQYVEVVQDKSQPTLLRGLINAFVYMDGVPHELKGDNQKACVDRWELGKPVFNRTYLGFCTHYCITPLSIHPGKPRENLKIERPFYYLEKSFLTGREFHDVADLKEKLLRWLQENNDRRRHRTTGRLPIEMYTEELPFLQPLPRAGYDTSVIEYRVVNSESAIQWEGYYYMIPRGYLYETLPVRVNESEITIYSSRLHPLVSYPLAEKGSKERYVGRSTPVRKQRLCEEELSTRLDAFGEQMREYAAQVKRYNPTTYRHHWQHLLCLKVGYSVGDILCAVRRASKYHVYEARAVENFLKVNATRQTEIDFSPQNRSHGQE